MNVVPYQIDENSTVRKLIPINPAKAGYQESWLQEVLRIHPNILPTAEIEPVFSPLIPIGKEVPTDSGYIDNLFISPQGYPVLVETKLWKNPEARRDVLAQSIDYAASLSNWNYSKLDEATRKYTRHFENSEIGLIDWIEQSTGETIEDASYFEENVSKNLRLGRILMLLVGDRIRSTVVDLLSHINKYPHLAMNVALIELQCFQLAEDEQWPLLVVPSLLARTEIIERSIVQVNVSIDGTYRVKAKQRKIAEVEKTSRTPLTEDEYWEKLKHEDERSYDKARILIDYYRNKDGIHLRPRQNSIAIHMFAPESGQRISLFFIRTDGVIECWHSTIAEQLGKAGLARELLDEYLQELKPMLKQRTKSLSIYSPAKDVDVDALILVVDRFIDRIMHAEPD